MSTAASYLGDLDAGGPDRWFKVELVKNRVKEPIKVTLMESQKPGFKQLSSAIGFGYAIATKEDVRRAAEQIVVNVGDYAKVIGEYEAKAVA